jgi:hypothetical protein
MKTLDPFKDLDKRSRLALRQALQDRDGSGAAPSAVVKKLARRNLVTLSGHTYDAQEWGKVVRRWPVFSLTDEGTRVAKAIVAELATRAPVGHSTVKTPSQLDAEIAETLSGKRLLRVFRRKAPGLYHVEAGSHSWAVFRVISDYGDLQWIIDRDDQPGFAQCDTLDCVRSTIIAAVRGSHK